MILLFTDKEIAIFVNLLFADNKIVLNLQEDVSTNLVLLYRGYYAEAFLLDVLQRYDTHGKKLFESNEKVYWDDQGLRNLRASGAMDSYIEKVIENAVYKHLLFLGYEVNVGVLNAGEVDFVCRKPGKTIYVQASYVVSEQSTRDREFGPLEKIKDNHPKYVISSTPLLTQRDENGMLDSILKCNALKRDSITLLP